MHNIYWVYKGYSGDEYGFAQRAANLANRWAFEGKSTLARCFSWLNQRGFGPGYFNNSGVYYQFHRSTFRTGQAYAAALTHMKAHYAIEVFETQASYMEEVARIRGVQKDMHKANPY